MVMVVMVLSGDGFGTGGDDRGDGFGDRGDGIGKI